MARIIEKARDTIGGRRLDKDEPGFVGTLSVQTLPKHGQDTSTVIGELHETRVFTAGDDEPKPSDGAGLFSQDGKPTTRAKTNPDGPNIW